MVELWDVQSKAVEKLKAGFRAGHKRQCLYSPTGSGKTEMSMYFIEGALRKRNPVAFLCDRIVLVEQTSKRFTNAGIRHGILQGDNTVGRSETVIISSAQTIESRGFWPGIELLIVDECHEVRQSLVDFIKRFPDVKVIGLTASPFKVGLGNIYSIVINTATTIELVQQGKLSKLKVHYGEAPDMEGAATNNFGEYTDSAAEDRGALVVGDVVNDWVKHTHKYFGGPVKTIVFSATVAHGQDICAQFQSAGYDFQQISHLDNKTKTGQDDRKRKIEEFRQGLITGLVSCEVLVKGFDVPDVMCGVSCRAYRKSFSAHIQQLGRVMRTHPGKEFALWLDHSGNYLGWYIDMMELYTNGVSSLSKVRVDKDRRRREKKDAPNLKCAECGFIMEPGLKICPSCGSERHRGRSRVDVVDGEMREAPGVDGAKPAWKKDPDFLWDNICRFASERAIGRTTVQSETEAYAARLAAALYLELGNHPFCPYDFEWKRGTIDQGVNTVCVASMESYKKRIRRKAS